MNLPRIQVNWNKVLNHRRTLFITCGRFPWKTSQSLSGIVGLSQLESALGGYRQLPRYTQHTATTGQIGHLWIPSNTSQTKDFQPSISKLLQYTKQEWKQCVQFMLVRATCCFLPPARGITCIPTDTDCEILTHVRGLPQRVRIVDLRKDQHLFRKVCHVRPLWKPKSWRFSSRNFSLRLTLWHPQLCYLSLGKRD